jgi:hypothetical protein
MSAWDTILQWFKTNPQSSRYKSSFSPEDNALLVERLGFFTPIDLSLVYNTQTNRAEMQRTPTWFLPFPVNVAGKQDIYRTQGKRLRLMGFTVLCPVGISCAGSLYFTLGDDANVFWTGAISQGALAALTQPFFFSVSFPNNGIILNQLVYNSGVAVAGGNIFFDFYGTEE